MKKIYLVLTYSGTMPSKIIKYYTKKKYSHISISLDKELNKMYSFGRINPYIWFIGGFIHENINKGTFKRFKNTQAKICVLQVSDIQYERLQILINEFESHKKDYRFNIIGVIAVAFKKKIKRRNYFYCAEFVKYALEQASINVNLPNIVKPQDFENSMVCYEGKLKDYNANETDKILALSSHIS